MGEFAVQNSDPRLGSLRWADWTNRASNLALVRAQGTVLIPVQELLPFQRQIVEEDVALALVLGQVALFTARVPIDEAWRILNVTLEHDDSVTHDVRFGYFPRAGAGNFRAISNLPVAVGQETPIYNSSAALAAATQFGVRGPVPVEFFPDDDINILDQTVAANANVLWGLRIRYEQIPLPLEQAIGSRFISTAI